MSTSNNITETGPMDWRGLQSLNNSQYSKETQDLLNTVEYITKFGNTPKGMASNILVGEESVNRDIPVFKDYGESKYDLESPSIHEYLNYQDNRGERQSTAAKWGAGLTKMVNLAATTFIGGIGGTIWGLGEAAIIGDAGKIINNSFTNALEEWNENMEEWLPNYRTDEERNRKWWQNAGTANFWADGFFKNLGFTIGALYSGGVYLAPLKGLKWLKAAGGLGNRILGTAFMGYTEAVGEGVRAGREYEKAELPKLDAAYNEQYYTILNDPTLDNEIKLSLLNDLGKRYEYQKLEIQQNKDNVASLDALGSFISTTTVDFFTLSKLYAGGWQKMKNSVKGIRSAGDAATRTLQYTYNPQNLKQAALRGALKGQLEGIEEMNQQWSTDTAKGYYTPDSPDFYNQVLTSDDHVEDATNFTKDVTEGFLSSWGNGDQWEQYAIGALTGMLGIPVGGRAFTQSENTLGQGNTFGIIGGIAGEVMEAKRENARAQELYNAMQPIAEKLQSTRDHLARSAVFNDLMSGYASEDNKWQFKNVEDDSIFEDIATFVRAGREQDLIDMITAASENISDEELAEIARGTSDSNTSADGTTNSKGWIDASGQYLSDSEIGRQSMREELKERAKTIIDGISDYKSSLEEIRSMTNVPLSISQESELAWLKWKTKQFDKRAKSIVKNSKESLMLLHTGLQNELRDMQEIQHQNILNGKKDEKLEKSIVNIEKLLEFVGTLQSSTSDTKVLELLAMNPKIRELLEDSEFINSIEQSAAKTSDTVIPNMSATMQELADITKLYKTKIDFLEKFIEYSTNPEKLDENKNKVITAIKNKKKKWEDNKKIKNVQNLTTSEIADKLDSGEIDAEDLKMSIDANEKLTDEEKQDLKNSLDNAAEFSKDKSEIINDINVALEGNTNISEEEKAEIIKDLNEALQDAQSSDELMELAQEAIIDLSEIDVESANKAQKALNDRKENKAKDKEVPKDINTETIDSKSTGKDETHTVEAVNNKSNPNTTTSTSKKSYSEKEINEGMKYEYEETTDSSVLPYDEVDYDTIRPTTSKLPIHQDKGNYTPYHQLLREGEAKSKRNGKVQILPKDEEKANEIEKVYNYLESNKAFENVDNGNVKVGDIITLGISETLEKNGVKRVILSKKQKDGSYLIVGDVESNSLYNKIKNEVQESSSEYKPSNVTIQVKSIKVGKVQYTGVQDKTVDDKNIYIQNKLKDIFGKNPVLFGYKKDKSFVSNLPKDSEIKNKDKIQSGRPVIFISTPIPNTYMAVPMNVGHFKDLWDSNIDSKNAIENLINSLAENLIAGNEELANDSLFQLKNLIYLRGIVKDGKLWISTAKSSKRTPINYSGKTKEELVNDITTYMLDSNPSLNIFEGMFQGSTGRKYSAWTNTIIQLSSANIVKNGNRTISNWFEASKPGESTTQEFVTSGFKNITIKGVEYEIFDDGKVKNKKTKEILDLGLERTTVLVAMQAKEDPRVNDNTRYYTVNIGNSNVIYDTKKQELLKSDSNEVSLRTLISEENSQVSRDKTTAHSYTIGASLYARLHSLMPNDIVYDRKNATRDAKIREEINSVENELIQYELNIPNLDEQWQNTVNSLSAKYNVDLSEYIKYNNDNVSTVKTIIKDTITGWDSLGAITRGDLADDIFRSYVENRIFPNKPDNISDNQWYSLINNIVEIVDTLEERGEHIIALPFVVHAELPNLGKVAGETDIITVDKDGNIRIYDIKTSRNSYYGNNPWLEHTKKQHDIQTSAYKIMLEEMLKSKGLNSKYRVVSRNIIPLHFTKGTVVAEEIYEFTEAPDISELKQSTIEEINKKLKSEKSGTEQESNKETNTQAVQTWQDSDLNNSHKKAIEKIKQSNLEIYEYLHTLTTEDAKKVLNNNRLTQMPQKITKDIVDSIIKQDRHYESSEHNTSGIQSLTEESAKRFNFNDLERLFFENCKDENQKILAHKVFEVAKKLGIKVNMLQKLADKVLGKYENNELFFSEYLTLDVNNAMLPNVILHEVIHSVVEEVLNKYNNGTLEDTSLKIAVEEIHRVYKAIKNNKLFKNDYGIISEYEMIAELANPIFRNKLKKQSLWTKIVNAIKKLFGIKTLNYEYSLLNSLDFVLNNYDYNIVVKTKNNLTNRKKNERLSELPRNVEGTILAWFKNNDNVESSNYAEILNYIHSNFKDNNTKLAAGWWLSRNSIRLEEDDYKVVRATQLIKNNKDDFMKYDNPMAAIIKYEKSAKKSEYINPKDVSTLTLSESFSEYGVEIYDVEESEESRQNLRKILNSHLGKRTSPWCLLQGDNEGNLTEDSKRYWRNYSTVQRQVAFKNGKIISFKSSNKSMNEWWDLQDISHTNSILLYRETQIPEDDKGRTANILLDMNNKNLMYGNIKRYYQKNNVAFHETWYDLTNIKSTQEEGLNHSKVEEYDKNGTLIYFNHLERTKKGNKQTIMDSEYGLELSEFTPTTYYKALYDKNNKLSYSEYSERLDDNNTVISNNIRGVLSTRYWNNGGELLSITEDKINNTNYFIPIQKTIDTCNKINKLIKVDKYNTRSRRKIKSMANSEVEPYLTNAMLFWKHGNEDGYREFKNSIILLQSNNYTKLDEEEAKYNIMSILSASLVGVNNYLDQQDIRNAVPVAKIPKEILNLDIQALDNVYNMLNTEELGTLNFKPLYMLRGFENSSLGFLAEPAKEIIINDYCN